MDKIFKTLCNTDNLVVFLSIAIICGNVAYVIAKTLEIPLSQIFHSTAVGSGIAALTILTVATLSRTLHQKKKKAIFAEKLEN